MCLFTLYHLQRIVANEIALALMPELRPLQALCPELF